MISGIYTSHMDINHPFLGIWIRKGDIVHVIELCTSNQHCDLKTTSLGAAGRTHIISITSERFHESFTRVPEKCESLLKLLFDYEDNHESKHS